MSEIAQLYEIRLYKEEDKAFIKATFLRGLYHGDSWFSLVPREEFMTAYSRITDALIASPRTVIKIACLKEDHDVILGYSILNTAEEIIHWVFVKKDWRRQGLAKSLIPSYISAATHLSALGLVLMKEKYSTCVFNPFKV